jgi:hypothetical protein
VAERVLSQRVRDTWRVYGIDDDLARVEDRVELTLGTRRGNVRLEFKSIHDGPLDLGGAQFVTLRAVTTPAVAHFVAQFTHPPEHPWAFRLIANNESALEAMVGYPLLVLSERDTEGFIFALTTRGMAEPLATFTTPATFTTRTNSFAGPCFVCSTTVRAGAGWLVSIRGRWRPACRSHHGGQRDAYGSVLFERAGSVSTGWSSDPELDRLLGQFDTRLPDDEVWPEVTTPRAYDVADRGSNLTGGRAYLRANGCLPVERAPVLTRPKLVIAPPARLTPDEIAAVIDERFATGSSWSPDGAADRIRQQVAKWRTENPYPSRDDGRDPLERSGWR